MKKLLVIIGILLIILVGMYIYKDNLNKKNVSIKEVENIEKYITKIYMWKEVTEEALPKFNNINEAPDVWVWEVVKQNLDKYELTYEEVQKNATKVFGNKFKKEFPKEGTDNISYNNDLKKYVTTGMGLDTEDDSFFIKKIEKNGNTYIVDIVEYLVDYQNSMLYDDQTEDWILEKSKNVEETYDVYIKNLNQEVIGTVKNSDEESKIIDIVKNNLDKFSSKKINIVKDSDNLYVESVE